MVYALCKAKTLAIFLLLCRTERFSMDNISTCNTGLSGVIIDDKTLDFPSM